MKLKQHHKTVLGMAAVCVDLIQLERNVYGHFSMRGDFDASLHTVQECVAGMVRQYLHDHHDRVLDYFDGLLGIALHCAPDEVLTRITDSFIDQLREINDDVLDAALGNVAQIVIGHLNDNSTTREEHVSPWWYFTQGERFMK